MRRHENFRPSGTPWFGDIPSHWRVLPLFAVAKKKSVCNRPEKELLSVYLDKGVVKFSDVDEKRTNATSEDLSAYQEVVPGDFVLNNQQAWRGSVGVSEYEGIVSPAYIVLELTYELQPRFANYLFRDSGMVSQYLVCSKGVGTIQRNVYWPQLKRAKVIVPPLKEQGNIVTFLDQKTTEIDAAIAKKGRLIELIEEQKRILIDEAVTKGLDPTCSQKETGISWIGTIPSHWEVKRAKYIFREIDERSANGDEELLSVSHMTGVTPRSEKTNIYMFMAEDYSGSKLCRPNDLVFNIMWAWMGALGVSERIGIVSPSYGVYRQLKDGTFNNWYLEHLLRSALYVAEYNKRSTGLHSSRLRLYSHMFFDMELGFPPREEQDKIERETKKQVSQADVVIRSIQSEIEKLAELRASLVASVVTGKIRV